MDYLSADSERRVSDKERIAELERENASLQERYDCNTAIMHARTKALAAAQATIQRKNEALRAINEVAPRYIECYAVHHSKEDRHEHDQPCPVIDKYESALLKIDEALALTADRTALDAMLAEARKEQAEQIIALAEHKAKRAQEYSDREEEDGGEPDYHAESIADGLLNLVREIRQAAERSDK